MIFLTCPPMDMSPNGIGFPWMSDGCDLSLIGFHGIGFPWMSDGCDLSLIGFPSRKNPTASLSSSCRRARLLSALGRPRTTTTTSTIRKFPRLPANRTTTSTSTIEDSRCLLPSSRRGCRISPGSKLEPRHRLEAYATLILGVSSDFSKASGRVRPDRCYG
jgi:hypothetical protein